MKTLSATQYFLSQDYVSSGYTYDHFVVRELGLYEITANLGLGWNNDNYDGSAIASIYIRDKAGTKYFFATNLQVSSGASFAPAFPQTPTTRSLVALEPGDYEVSYGVRRSGMYMANLTLLIEKIQ